MVVITLMVFRIWIVSYTGIPVKNVSTDCKEVICDKALQSRMYKMFPEEFERTLNQRTNQQVVQQDGIL